MHHEVTTKDGVFTYSLFAKDFDGNRKYAFRGDGKQLSPLFDNTTQARKWLKHNTILKEKTYAN